MLFKAQGKLRYSQNYKLVVEVEQDIVDFYRSLIPKSIKVSRGRWPAHITVVREKDGLDFPPNMEFWGKYEGEIIEFLYSNQIEYGKIYYWLNVYCVKLEEIRKELGLPYVSRIALPPEGFKKCFHMTIGNTKGL